MKTLSAALAALCLGASLVAAAATQQPPARDGIQVEGAWIRLLPGNLPSAGYFTLRNNTDRPVQLVGASSTAWRHVSLHESIGPGSMNHGGAAMGSMVPVDSVNVPPHGEVRFAPGGYHVMLSGAQRPVKAGQRVEVTLRLAGGAHVAVAFLVRPADATGPE